MKVMLVCKAAYRTTFFLDGSRISKKQSEIEINNSKRVEQAGFAWYNLKDYKGLYGEKTRLFLHQIK